MVGEVRTGIKAVQKPQKRQDFYLIVGVILVLVFSGYFIGLRVIGPTAENYFGKPIIWSDPTTEGPEVVLGVPLDNEVSNATTSFTFTCVVLEPPSDQIKNLSLYIWKEDEEEWFVDTRVVSEYPEYFVGSWADTPIYTLGTNYWNCLAYDINDELSWSDARTVAFDWETSQPSCEFSCEGDVFVVSDDTETYGFNDFAFFRDIQDTFHIIAIQSMKNPDGTYKSAVAADSENNFVHFTSSDLTGWTRQPDALSVGLPGSPDSRSIWAPHIVYNNGLYYMFYTGVSVEACPSAPQCYVQRIMLATSADALAWTKQGVILECDADWTSWDSASMPPGLESWSRDCRDPMVVEIEDGSWRMYIATRLDPSLGPDLVVGYARSDSIDSGWVLEDYIDTTRDLGEGPFSYRAANDLYYLTYGTGSRYLMAEGEAISSVSNAQSYSWPTAGPSEIMNIYNPVFDENMIVRAVRVNQSGDRRIVFKQIEQDQEGIFSGDRYANCFMCNPQPFLGSRMDQCNYEFDCGLGLHCIDYSVLGTTNTYQNDICCDFANPQAGEDVCCANRVSTGFGDPGSFAAGYSECWEVCGESGSTPGFTDLGSGHFITDGSAFCGPSGHCSCEEWSCDFDINDGDSSCDEYPFQPGQIERPKLLFGHEDIPVIADRIENSVEVKAAFDYMVLTVQPYLVMDYGVMPISDYGIHLVDKFSSGYLFLDDSDQRLLHGAKCREVVLNMLGANERYSNIMDTCGGVDNFYQESEILYTLNIGYDFCNDFLSEEEKQLVRDEIVQYVDYAVQNCQFQAQPGAVINKAGMTAFGLGFSYLNLKDDVDAQQLAVLSQGKNLADRILDDFVLPSSYDYEGAHSEGVLYALWTMRWLAPYMEASERLEGHDFIQDYPGLLKLADWLAYNMLPEGNARTNIINNAGWSPVTVHNTAVDWITHKAPDSESGRVAKWMWEHIYGTYSGAYPFHTNSDLLATILWYDESIPYENPGINIPLSRVFEDRGYYFYRTGWHDAESSDDIMFEFVPGGKFYGGHNQGDKNQFTFYQGDSKFLTDAGGVSTAHPFYFRSEYHNLVLVDGRGQVEQTNNCGSDGELEYFFLSPGVDFTVGDNGFAYSSYSEYSEEFCLNGGTNPVQHSFRDVLVVKDFDGLPYFVIFDDILKDGAQHDYTLNFQHSRGRIPDQTYIFQNEQSNALSITMDGRFLDVFFLNPDFGDMDISTSQVDDLLRTEFNYQNVQNPYFTYALVPEGLSQLTRYLAVSNGYGISFTKNQLQDFAIIRRGQGAVTADASGHQVLFDGDFSQLRFSNGILSGFSLLRGASLSVDGMGLISVAGVVGPAPSLYSDGISIYLSDPDAEYIIYGPGVQHVYWNEYELDFVKIGDYVYPGGIIQGDCSDQDSDGYSQEGGGHCCGPSGNDACGVQLDCDDNDALVNPVADEICSNGKDDNCDTQIDNPNDICSRYNIDGSQDGVELSDLVLVAVDFHGQPSQHAGGDTDVNDDENVNVLDLALVSTHFN